MAYRSPQTSDSGSPSPSDTNNNSRHVSPASRRSTAMARGQGESESSSRNPSARGTPNRASVDLPRAPNASKDGCWTCRLRRKKCDGQRDNDSGSCKTCRRLTIECLGWGQKRPEWMRDKQAVEAYKAEIKAQLTRAGLIRGQPRASMLQAQAQAQAAAAGSNSGTPQTRQPIHRFSAPADPSTGSSSSFGLEQDTFQRYGPTLIPGSHSNFLQLPAASYSDPNITSFDIGAPFFEYSPPQSITPLSSGGTEPLEFDLTQFDVNHQANFEGGFEFDLRPPSPAQHLPLLAGQTSMQEMHVMYYFENVTKLHFLFGGNTATNVTYSLIAQDPRGAVTNAICALACLHSSRMRVALGLEAPDPNPEPLTAKYFHDEAYYQLVSAKQLRGSHTESDVLAALHLICFSQMSGGPTDWQMLLGIALDWLAQIGLPNEDNPRLTLSNMTAAGQLVVKCTMWMDIFSTLTLMRPPKYMALYQRLLGPQNVFWSAENDIPSGLSMATLTGCPDEAMLGLAEVSVLAHWKAMEQRKGSLSLRELVRRGDDIEQRIHRRVSDATKIREQAPLHPSLAQGVGPDSGRTIPTADTFRTLSSIFRETVVLYLHTVLNDANPAVPEISSSVANIVQLLQQLHPSEIDRAVTFPICLAGCMTDDSARRDFLKGRLQSQDESIGNLMRIRLLMEAVWQKRDVTGRAVDWRETIVERGLNLLLV